MTNYNFNYTFKSINDIQKKSNHTVVFTGGNSPKVNNCLDFFNSKIQANVVIAADSGLETANEFNFKVDYILGDLDSLQDKNLINKFIQKKAILEQFNPYKDFTDTELALILAREVTYDNGIITLVGGSGLRVDHFFSNFSIYYSNLQIDYWLTEQQLITKVNKNLTCQILPKNANSPISVINYKNLANLKFNSNGLEWESNLFRNSFMPSLSNVIKKQNFDSNLLCTISCNEDFLLVTDLDTKVEFI